MESQKIDELKKTFGRAKAASDILVEESKTVQENLLAASRELWLEALRLAFPDVPFNVRGKIIEGSFANDPGSIIAVVEALKKKEITVHGIETDQFGFRLLC